MSACNATHSHKTLKSLECYEERPDTYPYLSFEGKHVFIKESILQVFINILQIMKLNTFFVRICVSNFTIQGYNIKDYDGKFVSKSNYDSQNKFEKDG